MSNAERQFRSVDRNPRFNQSNDRLNDGRSMKKESFPYRSISQQADKYNGVTSFPRKITGLLPMNKFDFSKSEAELLLKFLPYNEENETEDIYSQLSQKNHQITENLLKTIEFDCETITKGIESIIECPYLSRPYKSAQATRADLDVRVKFLNSIESNTPNFLNV